ncbi:hypothetical protein GBAR_LOCUS23824 [Geodia barretti]|uniref:Uncharacterized protein n=1 Tax=Geodia barretti TaxID=519541 RepID=A0AA35T7M5_GEOBA|nr:hypothetical protein GBAR_LOCUS23824 [Geodia barretti]
MVGPDGMVESFVSTGPLLYSLMICRRPRG